MSQKLLVIGAVWPEPTSSAAGWRMLDIISFFKDQSYQITFASAAQASEHSADLASLGVATQSIQLNHSSFDAFVSELNPEVVLFDRFMTEEQFGWRVAEFAPNAVRILDTEDLHCLRLARQKAVKENKQFSNRDLYSDEAKREIASIYRCDMTLMISMVEMNVLQEVFQVPNRLLHYLPFTISNVPEAKVTYEERRHFVSIGNFIHPPNWDAVLQLKQVVWPLIRKQLPKSELHVYGAYAGEKVLQLHQPKEGFLIKGRAESAQKVLSNARVLLAPLRFGAGMKGKLLDSMLTATPSITTSIGSESMELPTEWPGAVEDDFKAFAQKAVSIYNNRAEWQKASDRAQSHLNQKFDRAMYQREFSQMVAYLTTQLDTHRQSNFVGQMLHHHTARSTKYFAKWIEAKNKG